MNLFDLDQPILQLASDNEHTAFTLRHSFEGLAIFGGIGSGKSTGSARMVALKYLSAGYGGLVLTVKPDEKETWLEYCRLTGRLDDLIILEPGNNQYFNFLDYVSKSSSGEEEFTENIVEVLKTVIRAGEQKDSGKSDDAFWETALDMLIFNVIDLCKLAYGRVTVQTMFDIVQTIPQEKESIADDKSDNEFQKAFVTARENVIQKVKKWENSLSIGQKNELKDDAVYNIALLEAVPDAKLFKFLDQFFCETFKNLSEKTRSIIDFAFSGFLFRLLREPVYSMFCKNSSTVTPEDTFLNSKIILVNLPIKVYHKVGRDCQILCKYLYQRAIEKRNVTLNPRPVFLWADEAQNFLHEKDCDTQATARAARLATVYITQNLPSIYAVLGGANGQYKVKSFLGTLATKMFHANADIETNQYASQLVGDAFFEDLSSGITVAQNFSQSQNSSLKLERLIRPEGFVQLKTGGPLNKYKVEAILHRQGDVVRSGYNHTKLVFNQLYCPNNTL